MIDYREEEDLNTQRSTLIKNFKLLEGRIVLAIDGRYKEHLIDEKYIEELVEMQNEVVGSLTKISVSKNQVSLGRLRSSYTDLKKRFSEIVSNCPLDTIKPCEITPEIRQQRLKETKRRRKIAEKFLNKLNSAQKGDE